MDADYEMSFNAGELGYSLTSRSNYNVDHGRTLGEIASRLLHRYAIVFTETLISEACYRLRDSKESDIAIVLSSNTYKIVSILYCKQIVRAVSRGFDLTKTKVQQIISLQNTPIMLQTHHSALYALQLMFKSNHSHVIVLHNANTSSDIQKPIAVLDSLALAHDILSIVRSPIGLQIQQNIGDESNEHRKSEHGPVDETGKRNVPFGGFQKLWRILSFANDSSSTLNQSSSVFQSQCKALVSDALDKEEDCFGAEMSVKRVSVGEYQSVRSVCAVLAAAKVDTAAVVSKDKHSLVGVVSCSDIVFRVLCLDSKNDVEIDSLCDELHAKDIMSASAVTITKDTLLLDALQRMLAQRVRHLPIVHNASRSVYTVLSARQIAKELLIESCVLSRKRTLDEDEKSKSQLMFKIKLESRIRDAYIRFSVGFQDVSIDYLVYEVVRRLDVKQLETMKNIMFCYLDEDGDKVSIRNEDDLKEAIVLWMQSRDKVVRLTLDARSAKQKKQDLQDLLKSVSKSAAAFAKMASFKLPEEESEVNDEKEQKLKQEMEQNVVDSMIRSVEFPGFGETLVEDASDDDEKIEESSGIASSESAIPLYCEDEDAATVGNSEEQLTLRNESLLKTADSVLQRGELDKAMHLYSIVLQRSPNDSQTRCKRAGVLLVSGEFSQARDEYQKVIEQCILGDDSNENTLLVNNCRSGLAESCLEQKEYKKGFHTLLEIDENAIQMRTLETFLEEFNAQKSFGELAQTRQEWRSAVVYYSHAIQLDELLTQYSEITHHRHDSTLRICRARVYYTLMEYQNAHDDLEVAKKQNDLVSKESVSFAEQVEDALMKTQTQQDSKQQNTPDDFEEKKKKLAAFSAALKDLPF